VLPKRACTQDRASIHEAARDKARAIAKTKAYAISRRERKKVEMLFAHLKRILRLDRLRLRGPNGAKDEFLLAPPPKICGKWRSSSPFRRRSSPREAERPSFASLTAPPLKQIVAASREGFSTKFVDSGRPLCANRSFADDLPNGSYRPVPVRKECAKCSLGLNGAAIALDASCAEARSVRSKRQPQHPKHQANALTPAALKGI
jgi:hypothetical protein